MRIRIDHLSCRRAGRLLIDDLTITIAAGEALVVKGRNGAGKSTLLATLAGRLRPEAGRIRLERDGGQAAGHATEAEDDEARLAEHAVLVGHRDGLKSALTASENLVFAAAMLGAGGGGPSGDNARARAGDALDALETLGLAHVAAIPVGFLSAGQRRRVALARLLVVRRPVWLLDEPTAALDTAAQEDLAVLMRDHRQRGGIIIVATHMPLGLDAARSITIGGQSLGDCEALRDHEASAADDWDFGA